MSLVYIARGRVLRVWVFFFFLSCVGWLDSLLVYISLESISTLPETPFPKVHECEAYTVAFNWIFSMVHFRQLFYVHYLPLLRFLFVTCYDAVCHFSAMLAIWLHSCVFAFFPVQGMMTSIWPQTVFFPHDRQFYIAIFSLYIAQQVSHIFVYFALSHM